MFKAQRICNLVVRFSKYVVVLGFLKRVIIYVTAKFVSKFYPLSNVSPKRAL